MLFIFRSVKRLNKVTKSIYEFIMDLTTNAFQSVYVVSSSGSKWEIKDFLVFVGFYTICES